MGCAASVADDPRTSNRNPRLTPSNSINHAPTNDQRNNNKPDTNKPGTPATTAVGGAVSSTEAAPVSPSGASSSQTEKMPASRKANDFAESKPENHHHMPASPSQPTPTITPNAAALRNPRGSVSKLLASPTHSSKYHLLLVVEDESASAAPPTPSAKLSLKGALEKTHRVTCVNSSETAFAALRTFNTLRPSASDSAKVAEDENLQRGGWVNADSFDGVLLSLTPGKAGVDGSAFLTRLKAHNVYQHLPVLTMLDMAHPSLADRGGIIEGTSLLNQSIMLGADDFLLLCNANPQPVPEYVLDSKLRSLFRAKVHQNQQGGLIQRGDEYKKQLEATKKTVENHQKKIQQLEIQTKNLSGHLHHSSLSEEEKERKIRAEKVDEFNETPLTIIRKKFDAILKNPLFAAPAKASSSVGSTSVLPGAVNTESNDKVVSQELIDELHTLRNLLASNNNLYQPDFESLAAKSIDSSNALGVAGGASWLRARFSVVEPKSPLMGDLHARSGSFIAVPVHNPSNLNHKCLEAFEDPFFNIFEWTVDDLLPCMSLLMHHFDLLSLLKIKEDKLRHFFYQVPSMYQIVPYHNVLHGINVFQFLYCCCRHMDAKDFLTPKELLAVLIGGLAHDMDHPGLNNSYMIDTNSEVALIYNDQSVLENHHCSTLFKLLRQKENDIFEGMKEADKRDIRQVIIASILATDMSKHFELHSLFKNKLASRKDEFTSPFNKSEAKDRSLIAQMLVKCSDIGNVACEWTVSNEWGSRANMEFFFQGDLERAAGRTPAPFLDRQKMTGEANTLGFIDYVARPLFQSLFDFLPKSKAYLDAVDTNRGKLAEIVKEQKEKKEKEEKEKAAAAPASAAAATPAVEAASATTPAPVSTVAPNATAFLSEAMRLSDAKRFIPRTAPSFSLAQPSGPLYRGPMLLYPSNLNIDEGEEDDDDPTNNIAEEDEEEA